MQIVGQITKKIEYVISLFPILMRINTLYYEKIVEREIKLGSIGKKDKVLCIGGGPFPCTALEIARKTGAQVYVIDNDPKAVKRAGKVIKLLKMSQRVYALEGDGQNIDVSDFTVIHVALQAQPHDLILNNAWQKASAGSRILLRHPLDCLNCLYTALPQSFPSQENNKIVQQNCTMKATLLFIKGWERKNLEEKVTISSKHFSSSSNTSLVS